MKRYLQLTLQARSECWEQLIAELLEWGFEGFEEDEPLLRAYRPLKGPEMPDWQAIRAQLRRYDPDLQLAWRVLEPEDWTARWAASIEPIEVGPFLIRPSWKAVPLPPGRIELLIDPKMAFGTGYHESTRLALRALARWVQPGVRLLDVGTGTGILAIAALKLGASRALAIDVDEWAFTNAAENAALNGLEDRLEVRLGSLEVVPERDFGLVVANLTRELIRELLPALRERMAPGAVMIWSGLLLSDGPMLEGEIARYGLSLLERPTEGEWMAWVLCG
nr:MAG: ribosomal protein L11 methyltransferase [Bacteroidota bacterium]